MANPRNRLSLREDRVVIITDENNNEVTTHVNGLSLKKVAVFFGMVAAVVCVATIAVVGSDSIGGSAMADVQSRPNRMAHLLKAGKLLTKTNSLSPEKLEKLRKIRELKGEKPSEKPEEIRADICYTSACLDTSLDILGAMNRSVAPCEDFYQYACGRWLATNPLPASQSRWSRFNRLRDTVNTITQQILNAPKDMADALPINQVKDFYSDCVNVDALESLGLDPVKNILRDDLGGWPILDSAWDDSSFDTMATIGTIRREFLDDAIIGVYVSQDLKNTVANSIYLDQSSFFIPRSMLVAPTTYPNQIAAYKTYLTAIATKFGSNLTPAALATAVDNVVDFEIQLAQASSSDEDRYDMERIYNPKNLDEFQTELDPSLESVNLNVLLSFVFATSGVVVPANERVIALEVDYLHALVTILNSTPKSTIANYLLWRVASGLIPDTTQDMRDTQFEFNRVLTGATAPQTRNVTCANAANGGFGMAIGVKYIAAAFDLEAKEEVDGLVENLRTSFRDMLTTSDWMLNPETRAAADEKAVKMKSFMAFPEWLEDKDRVEEEFAGLTIIAGSYLESGIQLTSWLGDKSLKKLREPTSKDEWLTYPGVVNAFYSPEHNSITFPAGILQPPFFGKGRHMSQNFGGIGVVIGHEITHGFDNQGSQFDGDGNVADWWDATTRAEYERKTTCVRDQYSAFVTPVGNVDGGLTLGENIADNGGLRESLFAYRLYLEANPELKLPGLEELSNEQLFFLGYANIWCENITPAGLEAQLLSDPHSPAEFRVKGPLRNSVEFTAAYNCQVGDYMRPPDAERCVVW